MAKGGGVLPKGMAWQKRFELQAASYQPNGNANRNKCSPQIAIPGCRASLPHGPCVKLEINDGQPDREPKANQHQRPVVPRQLPHLRRNIRQDI